jgi:hypothetical protein
LSWLYYTAHIGNEKQDHGPGIRIADRTERIRLARSAIERLLDAGLVEIIEYTEGEERTLSADEAKTVIADDRNWIYEEADPPETFVRIVQTDAGYELWGAGGE